MSMKNLKFHFYKDWVFINIFNIISINWERRKVIKGIKGLFIPLKWHFTFTRNYSPFMYNCHYGKLLSITIRDVEWKDKYQTPRHEENPFISIGIFNKFFFNWEYRLPFANHWMYDDDYWEQALWYLYYYKEYNCKIPFINEAIKYWPYTDYETGKSSWNNKYLVCNEIH